MKPLLPLLLLTACRPATVDHPPMEPGRVVVLVLDGLRIDESMGDGISELDGKPAWSHLPSIEAELLPQGALIHAARTTGVPITTEAHTELLTGRRQALATFPPADTHSYRSDVPTLFEALREARGLGEEGAAVVVNTIHLNDLLTSLYPGLGADHGPTFVDVTPANQQDPPDTIVLDHVRDQLEAQDTHLLVANLHRIDLAGHTGDVQGYLDRIAAVDDPIVELWDWIEATPPYAGNTTLILTADHGRHRDPRDEDAWSNHGDQCAGCRSLPMLLLGRGIKPGALVDQEANLLDLSATIAALLDVDMPYAEGAVIDQALLDPPDPGRPRGSGSPAAQVGASRQWSVRGGSEIHVEEAQLSSPEAREAGAPVGLETPAGGLLCWRELPPEGSWRGRCALEDSTGWRDLPDVSEVVSPFWRPALALDAAARPWMAWVDNPNGWTGAAGAGPALARLEGGEWVHSAGPEISYATDPAIAPEGEDALVAVACSEVESSGRDTRRIALWRVSWPAVGEATWSQLLLPSVDAERLERPALFVDGDSLLAALASKPDGTRVVGFELGSGQAFEVDPRGRVLGHIAPRWSPEGVLAWARLGDTTTVEICGWDGALACVDTGADAVDGLDWGPQGLEVGLRIEGIWAIQTLTDLL